jgi:hypothetical protein
MVEHDLDRFRSANAQRLADGLRNANPPSSFTTTLASRLDPDTIRRITPPPNPPQPARPAPRPRKPLQQTDAELFEAALDALPSHSILDADKE